MGPPTRTVVVAPLLLLLLPFACGYGRSQTLHDAPPVEPHPPSPPAVEDGGPCVDGLDVGCIDPCGDPVSPSCVGGDWQCPDYGLGAQCQIEDAGFDACATEPHITCTEPSPCPGIWTEPACSDGEWTCRSHGQCDVDVWAPAPPDAGLSPDAALPPQTWCGYTQCDPATSYCQRPALGGPATEQCLPFPPTCPTDAPSCACVAYGECGCVDESGGVIVICASP